VEKLADGPSSQQCSVRLEAREIGDEADSEAVHVLPCPRSPLPLPL